MTDARSTPPNPAAVAAPSDSSGTVDPLESRLGPEIRNTGLRSREIDAIKGILIVCIALGHNGHFPAGVPFLYAFHVAGFLILPFLFPIGPLSAQFVRDRAVRYLVPYLAFSSLCIVYPFVAPDWKPVDVLGVFLASALSIKAATGFELYWFLPCFFMLTVLRALRVQLSSGGGWLLLGIAVSINAGVGWLSAEQLFYSPFGIATALFMYPLGVGAAWLWRVGRSRRAVTGAVAVAVWVVCAVVLHQVDSSANVAGCGSTGLVSPSSGSSIT